MQFDVDLSSVQPNETLTATSSVNLQNIDLEGTKRTMLGQWDLALGAGIRYGEFDTQWASGLHTPAGQATDVGVFGLFVGVGWVR